MDEIADELLVGTVEDVGGKALIWQNIRGVAYSN